MTGLSHLLDCQLFGLQAGAHHLANILLHAATAVLLFLVLQRMTGGWWPSAMVAALFAVHPLHVESVAWIAERKDVLSGLCFVLTLGAYVGYARKPFSLGRYLLVTALFALGLMAKPMLVTLPLLLLLLDYWPLGRMADSPSGRPARLLIEKLPLLLLTAVFCVTTIWTQTGASAIDECLRFWPRLGNALVSYVAYLIQLVCPLGLAVYYPHPGDALPVWKVIGATCVLAGISAAALRVPAALSVFAGGLAVVRGDARAGERSDRAGWRACHG